MQLLRIKFLFKFFYNFSITIFFFIFKIFLKTFLNDRFFIYFKEVFKILSSLNIFLN